MPADVGLDSQPTASSAVVVNLIESATVKQASVRGGVWTVTRQDCIDGAGLIVRQVTSLHRKHTTVMLDS